MNSNVILISTDSKERRVFEYTHAERLLFMIGGCWELPVDSEYKFDFENGITRREHTAFVGVDTGKAENAKESRGNKKSKRAGK